MTNGSIFMLQSFRQSIVAGQVLYGQTLSMLMKVFEPLGVDPRFADPTKDFHLKSTAGRWDPAANSGSGAFVKDGQDSPGIDSGDPGDPELLVHTTRVVGSVTAAICALKPGDTVGVRGPFGSHWPVEDARGADVVFVAGGIGLAPLRPAIYQIMADREHYGNVVIFYGSRTPEDLLYRRELQRWRGRFDMSTEIIVDRATGHWGGRVGVVTKLIRGGGFDRHHSIAFVCGPEVMMRFAVQTLGECGVTGDRVFRSMERNMKCALGFCGHCQFGPTFVCRDGPVYRYDAIERLFNVWEV